MNERILELAEQAVSAVDVVYEDNPLNEELAKMYIPDCFAEKFAEMIVRECAQFVEDTYDLLGDEILIKEEMLEHFGVDK
jgi:hypothetical protein